MRSTQREKDHIRTYVEQQAHEDVVHLEKVGSDVVGLNRHDIWDVHCPDSRWWVATNMTNLYDQADFKSRDVVLTFHVGLMARLMHQQTRSTDIRPDAEALLPGSWRRWEQAFRDLSTRRTRPRRTRRSACGCGSACCRSCRRRATRRWWRTAGQHPRRATSAPGRSCWPTLWPAGASAAKLRSYLKKTALETWDYVNWLTHHKNAVRMDAEIGLKIVEHVLGTFTAARLRLERTSRRCAECGSYAVGAGVCAHCEWEDPGYEPPVMLEVSDEDRARRLAEPCTPSSDISTFMGLGR